MAKEVDPPSMETPDSSTGGRRIPPGDEPPMSLSKLFDIYGLMATPYMFDAEKLTPKIVDRLDTEIRRLDHLSYDTQNMTSMFIVMAYEYLQEIKKKSRRERRAEVREAELEEKIAQLQSENSELEKIAYTDELTDIFNRRGFVKELKAELERFNNPTNLGRRRDDGAAVVFIDLRKFKPINDRFGHDAGDIALKKVAQILQETIREQDTVGRWGGDEFVILINNINSADSEAVYQRLIEALDKITFNFEGNMIEFSARLGKFHVNPGQEPAQIMHEADMAMINSKDPRDREGAIAALDAVAAGRGVPADVPKAPQVL